MAKGSYTTESFVSYSTSRGRSVSTDGFVTSNDYRDYYKQTRIHPDLVPLNVVRECVDYEDHPNTIPVILCLDLTGSMSNACARTAQSLNKIMTSLYERYADIEFLIMGVGDLECDYAPVQVSQFEVDVKIVEHTDKLYIEHGGGGNDYESYTAAWYFGLKHTKLDCWKRGKKGIIITMGDETLNPILHKEQVNAVFGDTLQADVETKELYDMVREKFDIYHIAIDDDATAYSYYARRIESSWGQLLKDNFSVSTLQELPKTIVKCIVKSLGEGDNVKTTAPEKRTSGLISW